MIVFVYHKDLVFIQGNPNANVNNNSNKPPPTLFIFNTNKINNRLILFLYRTLITTDKRTHFNQLTFIPASTIEDYGNSTFYHTDLVYLRP